jgi:hypothetical protein
LKRPIVILFIISIGFLITAIFTMISQLSSQRAFQTTEAISLGNEMIKYQSRGVTYYRPEATLRYVVNGETYTTPFSLPKAYDDPKLAKIEIDKYAPLMKTEVYYNSADPSDIVMSADTTSRFFLMPLLYGAISAVAGVICLIMFINMNRLRCPTCAVSVTRYFRFCYSCGNKLPRQLKGLR